MSFPRYPAYKDSGVEWLGEVPEHWQRVQLGRIVKEIQTGPFGSQLHSSDYVPDETPILNPSNIQDGRIVPDWFSTVGSEVLAGLEQHMLQDGDLLIGRRGEMGRCALVTKNEAGWLVGTGSIKVRLGDVAVPRHFAYYLSTSFTRDFLSLESVGSTMENLNASILSRVPVLLPPRPEQCVIATFLDRETAKIDALVAEYRTLIDLLKEKRQAVISHAVTKGLDPAVPMKDSGVEWLGEVPEHWGVGSLKRDLEFLTSGSRGWAEHYADEGALFLRISNLTRDSILLDLSDMQRVDVPKGSEGERTRVRCGDVLFSITAYLGSVAVVPDGLEEAYVSQHVALARLYGQLFLPTWVGYVTLSVSGQSFVAVQAYGGTKIQLSLDDIRGLVLPLPPLSEQRLIVESLDRETAKVDALVAEAEQAISLLQERRTALISAAVTGKIDVRGLVERDQAA